MVCDGGCRNPSEGLGEGHEECRVLLHESLQYQDGAFFGAQGEVNVNSYCSH
jgi:hypothetical protein